MLLRLYSIVKKIQLVVVSLTIASAPFLFVGGVSAFSSGSVVGSMNQYRASSGLGAYTSNAKLQSSAYVKAQDMCTKDYWSHTSPSGVTAWTLVANAGYSYKSAGENLAKGYTSAESVLSGWMNSAGHRANVLSSVFTEVGVSVYPCTSPDGVAYVLTVAHFAAPKSQAPVTTTAPPPTSTAVKTTPATTTTTQDPTTVKTTIQTAEKTTATPRQKVTTTQPVQEQKTEKLVEKVAEEKQQDKMEEKSAQTVIYEYTTQILTETLRIDSTRYFEEFLAD